MTAIRIEKVTKRYAATVAVDAVSLDIADGELFFMLGPSGCGKTTLLRILAGFAHPDEGEVYFGPDRITQLPPRARDAGMVFQQYALWPHMTVEENVAYGLRVRGVGRKERSQKVEEALRLVRLTGLGQRRPNQLSGGQQQRVALARALVIQPRVLLLDEPLSNLDARLRDEMREEIRRLHDETRLTMVYVTHDQKEALSLADRLVVMDRGRLAQVGTPAEVYDRPATRFVASFLGDSNFIPGKLRQASADGCVVETAFGDLRGVPANGGLSAGAAVLCSIRPHGLVLDAGTDGGENRIPGRIARVAFLGEIAQLHVTAGPMTLLVSSPPQVAGRVKTGDGVTLGAARDLVVVLADETPRTGP
jgi:iron(III) transport system ATP-binding protein